MLEEQDIHADHDGYHREHVKHDGCRSSHRFVLLRAAERGNKGVCAMTRIVVGRSRPPGPASPEPGLTMQPAPLSDRTLAEANQAGEWTPPGAQNRGVTVWTALGSPGGPPGLEVYSGAPMQVNRSPCMFAWPSRPGMSPSTNVIPDAAAPRA
jgi:hypothetical protein